MADSRSQLATTVTCALIALSTVAALARSQVATAAAKAPEQAQQVQQTRTNPSADGPLEKRNVVIKLEIVRTQANGDKDSETETYRGVVGARIASIGLSARSTTLLRTVRAVVRDVKDGLVYLDLDVDEGEGGNRDTATMDRQISTSLAIKEGETVLVKSYHWKSNPVKAGQSEGKETNTELLTFVTANSVP